MRQIKNNSKNSVIKKIFIKICRILGFEIIDQNSFFIPTLGKEVNDNLNILGKKSINLPLGEVAITRKVKSLDIIIRTCTSVEMLTQSKKRIFEKNKSEYTLKTINSLLESSCYDKNLENLSIKFTIIDHNSSEEDLKKIEELFNKYKIEFKLINLKIENFSKRIKKINEKKNEVSINQISNMSNIYQSLIESENAEDLIYFVEDDYIHKKECIAEMIYAYERLGSQLGDELFLCPADYPYLYSKYENTQIVLGGKCHWRKIEETLCTFLTSKKMVKKYFSELQSMCEYEHYPFEKPLHNIYKKEMCFSPIPSLAVHFTNINSIFGLSPNIDWKKLWDENKVL